jgi:flavin reductase (DIM6/NTAB) family NADH-FMN oxidoreductase RutF
MPTVNDDAKKTALRMIPYGLYVMTAQARDGAAVSAATVNWVTQASFSPPLVAVGVKKDSGGHDLVKAAGAFALNILGKSQSQLAFAFFKPTQRQGDLINEQRFRAGTTGAPILDAVPAWLECKLLETVERGDHSIFIGEVVEAGVRGAIDGRPDEASLWLKELGPKVFYGG